MDTYTVDLITILNVLVAGGAMIFIALSHRQAPGFASVGIGLLSLGFALIVVVMRLFVPGNTIVLFSDVVLFVSALYLANGLRVFCGRPPLSAAAAAPVLALLGSGIVYFLYVDDRPALRVALVSVLFAMVTIAGGIATYGKSMREDRAVYRMTAGVLFFNAAFLIVRAAHAFGGPLSGLMGEGPIETGHLVTLNVGIIVAGFGLVTASNLRLKREVEALALSDPLTGLPNRRFFEERLQQAGRRASRTGERLAILYLDVDGFKQLNDSLGHAAGDAALQALAERLSETARESDCVARLGGDEFVVLIENAPPKAELSRLIARLKDRVAMDFEFTGRRIRISVSCGLSMLPDDVEAVCELVNEADHAMYAEKMRHRS